MGLPNPSLLLSKKFRNSNGSSAQTTGYPEATLSKSVKYKEEPGSMATFGPGSATVKSVHNNLIDRLSLKYVDSFISSCEGRKTERAYFAVFDKFKSKLKETVGDTGREQWISMMGTSGSTSYSRICRAGKLSASFRQSSAACSPKHVQSRRIENQSNICIPDKALVADILCIGVEDLSRYSLDYVRDGEESSPESRGREKAELEMSLELHSLKSGSPNQSVDAARLCSEHDMSILSKLDLPPPKHLSSSVAKYWDPPNIQSVEDPRLPEDKLEQRSPISVLEQLFEDKSPRPVDTKPKKTATQPHINFDERSPMKPLKFHSAVTSKPSLLFKKQTRTAAEYTRAVLEASRLDWYQLALKWHRSTQFLDASIYTNTGSQSGITTEQERRLLFDHINEVLLNIYQPYYGFYPWISLREPSKQHVVAQRNLVNEVIRIVEKNLLFEDRKVPAEELVINAMDKSGTWTDMRLEIEDLVLEVVESLEEELVDELVFELWMD